jgi:hypothetical protein
MAARALLRVTFFAACLLAACSSSSSEPANAGADGPGTTAGTAPASPVDPSAEDPGDAGAADAAAPHDAAADALDPNGILGTLSGACGVISALLGSPTSALEDNQLVFVAGETYDKASLSPGGQTLFDTPNAGGSSTESEVMSFEVLHYCEGATLLKTETEILYAPPDDAGPSTITDVLVSIGGQKVGVSVTRAYKPSNVTFTDADVKALLVKKLEGINRSSVRVLPADKWVKQILHVFTANKAATDAVGRVYPTIASDVRADTIVLVTETVGGGFVYCNPDPPLGSECP